MSKIVWDASFSVNNDQLDAQHRTWFEILNRLHDAMIHADADELVYAKADSLRAMLDYTRLHFETEEAYMREHRYPGLAEHLKLHHDFIDHVTALDRELQAGKLLLGTAIVKFMQDWLTTHIASEDRKYATYIG